MVIVAALKTTAMGFVLRSAVGSTARCRSVVDPQAGPRAFVPLVVRRMVQGFLARGFGIERRNRHPANDVVGLCLVAAVDDVSLLLEREHSRSRRWSIRFRLQLTGCNAVVLDHEEGRVDLRHLIAPGTRRDV